MASEKLHWVDYVIFAIVLAISLGIGIYYSIAGGGQNTTSKYLMGNRKLSTIPVALSMFMSIISGIFVLGTSAEMYIYGTQLWMQSVVDSIFVLVSAYLFIPLMYKLKVTSAFQYYPLRFNFEPLHIVCVILAIMIGLVYMGMAMYAPATAIEAVAGFPVWATLICISVVSLIYTTIGGLKAVVVTDFFQGIIMFAGLIIIFIVGCIKVGGLTKVWDISKDGGRINFFNMDPDPTVRMSFWTVLVSQAITSIAKCIAHQPTVMRYSAVTTIKQAYLVVIWQIPLTLLLYVLVCLCGLTVYAYYETIGCDPYRSEAISNSNQLLAYFLVDGIGYTGLTGLFIAVLFSGALSSISSSMNSISAITWKDILEKHFKGISEYGRALVTKVVSFIAGVIGVGLGFTIEYFQGNIMQLSTILFSGLSAPLIGVVLCGSLIPCVTGPGMMIGAFAGMIMISWCNVGQLLHYPHRSYLNTTVENCTFLDNRTAIEIPDDLDNILWIYKISFQYVPLTGVLSTMIVGVIASLIIGRQNQKTLNHSTVVNLSARCCCCYPESCQNKCMCGVPFDEDNAKEDGSGKAESVGAGDKGKICDSVEIPKYKEKSNKLMDQQNGQYNQAYSMDIFTFSTKL